MTGYWVALNNAKKIFGSLPPKHRWYPDDDILVFFPILDPILKTLPVKLERRLGPPFIVFLHQSRNAWLKTVTKEWFNIWTIKGNLHAIFANKIFFLRCSMIVLWFQDMSDTNIHWDQCFHAIFNTFRCVNLSRTCVTSFDSIRPLAIAKICKTDSPPKISKIDTMDALADAMLTMLTILLTPP